MIITIDGPAGSGKTTAARRLAARLGIPYLDTGAMYRVVTLAALRAGTDLEDDAALGELVTRIDFQLDPRPEGVHVTLDGADVTEEIRTMRVNDHTPYVAASPSVRAALIEKQRAVGARVGTLVTEGRDQGTAAFPHADIKFFLRAELDTRAERRLRELQQKRREAVSLDAVRANLSQRDRTDAERPVAPLIKPPDALEIDTTRLSIDGVVTAMLEHLQRAGLWREPRS